MLAVAVEYVFSGRWPPSFEAPIAVTEYRCRTKHWRGYLLKLSMSRSARLRTGRRSTGTASAFASDHRRYDRR